MRFYNSSDRELVLPDGTRLMPKHEVDLTPEQATSWSNHPVIQGWAKDKWIEAELPDEGDDDPDGNAVTKDNVEDLTRSKLVRFLKANNVSSRGSRDELLERAKEVLEGQE